MLIKHNTKTGIIFDERPKSQTYYGRDIPQYVLSIRKYWERDRLISIKSHTRKLKVPNKNDVLEFNITYGQCISATLEKSLKEHKLFVIEILDAIQK